MLQQFRTDTYKGYWSIVGLGMQIILFEDRGHIHLAQSGHLVMPSSHLTEQNYFKEFISSVKLFSNKFRRSYICSVFSTPFSPLNNCHTPYRYILNLGILEFGRAFNLGMLLVSSNVKKTAG